MSIRTNGSSNLIHLKQKWWRIQKLTYTDEALFQYSESIFILGCPFSLLVFTLYFIKIIILRMNLLNREELLEQELNLLNSTGPTLSSYYNYEPDRPIFV